MFLRLLMDVTCFLSTGILLVLFFFPIRYLVIEVPYNTTILEFSIYLKYNEQSLYELTTHLQYYWFILLHITLTMKYIKQMIFLLQIYCNGYINNNINTIYITWIRDTHQGTALNL